MENRKKTLTSVFLVAVCIVIVIFIAYGSCERNSTNKVAGTYREDNLTFVLKGNNSFEFTNRMAGTSATGSYSFSMSDDGSKAYVNFTTSSGLCSYTGAVIYYYGNETFLVPTISGSEIVARRMVKIK